MRFSGEEYSADPEEVRPQNLAPNDSMVFLQDLATCAPEAVTDASEVHMTVTWKDPVTFAEQSLELRRTFGDLLAGDTQQLRKGAAIFAYAEALKTTKGGDAAAWAAAAGAWLAAQQAAEAALPHDADLSEIRDVMAALGAPGA